MLSIDHKEAYIICDNMGLLGTNGLYLHIYLSGLDDFKR